MVVYLEGRDSHNGVAGRLKYYDLNIFSISTEWTWQIRSGFFSPILRLWEQQNFRNVEFRREILEFSRKSYHFNGDNLEFPLSLVEKTRFFGEKPFRKVLRKFLELPGEWRCSRDLPGDALFCLLYGLEQAKTWPYVTRKELGFQWEYHLSWHPQKLFS